jgi:hypothetical protein
MSAHSKWPHITPNIDIKIPTRWYHFVHVWPDLGSLQARIVKMQSHRSHLQRPPFDSYKWDKSYGTTLVLIDADIALQIQKYNRNSAIQTEFSITPQWLNQFTPNFYCWEAPDDLYPSYLIPSTEENWFLLHKRWNISKSPLATSFPLDQHSNLHR